MASITNPTCFHIEVFFLGHPNATREEIEVYVDKLRAGSVFRIVAKDKIKTALREHLAEIKQRCRENDAPRIEKLEQLLQLWPEVTQPAPTITGNR